jgi:hypothetical protein
MLQVEPVVGPDGETVDINALLKIGEEQFTTHGTTKVGRAIFLGSLDGSTSDSVQLAFLRIIKQ